jgi:rifampicin phosphotransferase
MLGGADRRALGVSPKAALLHRAALAGIRVPAGMVVPDELFDTWATLEQPIPAELSGSELAVRSAFAAEDAAHVSGAGAFTSVLRIRSDDVPAVLDAAHRVRASGALTAGRRDMLVMRMVPAVTSGVAFTEHAHEDDLVNSVEGTAEALLSGHVTGRTLELPRLRDGEPASRGVPAWAARLQSLLRDVRRFARANQWGGDDWDVEWADDGTTCWLVQLRPITRATVRNEWFTLANHREILPPLPSRFMTTLIASCAGGLFSWYRRFDPGLPATRPFIEIVAGRPVINQSLLTDMMRRWGLPTRLVSDSIGGRDVAHVPLNFRRVRQALPVLARLAWAQWRSVSHARQARLVMLSADLLETEGRFGPLLQGIQRRYVLLVQSMFALTAAMSLPLALLRRVGVLAAHLSRQRTPGSDVVESLRRDVVPAIRGVPADVARVATGNPPQQPAGAFEWKQWLERHGHRGPYESDLAQPRWREQPQAVLALLRHELAYPIAPRSPLGRSAREWFTLPLWWWAGRPLRAREALRDDAMMAFAMIRELLHDAADNAVARGALTARDDVWLLSIDEVLALDAGARYDETFIAARTQEREREAARTLPESFQRFDTRDETAPRPSVPADTARGWQGIGLAPGIVQGKAWVAPGPTASPPPEWRPEETILVTEAVDAAWALLFRRVGGVVIATGGELSHASIILRELAVPSVTNVRGAVANLRFGDAIEIDGRWGVVRKLS